jgi:hypothetical protein
MENQVNFRMRGQGSQKNSLTESETYIVPHKGFTMLDKPYEFMRSMRKIPNQINLQQFRIISNYLALSLGNPGISNADSIKVFNIMRRIFNVRGNTIPKRKLVAMSKNEVNKRAGVGPIEIKGMNKHKCCKSCPTKYNYSLKCDCAWDGTGYTCAGSHCDNNNDADNTCCHCDGWPNFSSC